MEQAAIVHATHAHREGSGSPSPPPPTKANLRAWWNQFKFIQKTKAANPGQKDFVPGYGYGPKGASLYPLSLRASCSCVLTVENSNYSTASSVVADTDAHTLPLPFTLRSARKCRWWRSPRLWRAPPRKPALCIRPDLYRQRQRRALRVGRHPCCRRQMWSVPQGERYASPTAFPVSSILRRSLIFVYSSYGNRRDVSCEWIE